MLTHEAFIFYAVVHTALIACLIVLAGMGVRRINMWGQLRRRQNDE